MVLKVFCFSALCTSSIAGGAQASEYFYKFVTTSNLLICLVSAMVDTILN